MIPHYAAFWVISIPEIYFCYEFPLFRVCPANFTLSENRNVTVVDVNTKSCCFVIPLTPVHTCELDNIRLVNSTENYVTNLGYLVINNWTSVNINNRDLNTLDCDAGEPNELTTCYANFYSLSKHSY